MNKRLYILPGYAETARRKNYREIKKEAKVLGFRIVNVNIDWDTEKNIDDYVDEVVQKLQSITNKDVVLGFSFGALILTILADQIKCKSLILCSVAPYFSEDLRLIPQESKDYFGERFIRSLEKIEVPFTTTTRTFLFVGSNDWPLAIERARKISELWQKNSKLQIIKNVGHELSSPEYTVVLKELF